MSETDEAQKAIIDKVKDGKMVELSTDAFAGMDIKRRDIRTFKKDETTKDESIFEVGSVIAFKTPHKGIRLVSCAFFQSVWILLRTLPGIMRMQL